MHTPGRQISQYLPCFDGARIQSSYDRLELWEHQLNAERLLWKEHLLAVQCTVYVHCRASRWYEDCIRAPPKQGRYWEIWRDFLRRERFHKGGGDGFPWSTDIFSHRQSFYSYGSGNPSLWTIHPRWPKDFPRPKSYPEGEAREKSWGSREISRAERMDFPIPPKFWWSTDILSASSFLQGVDQEILQPITMVPIENLGIYIFCNT